MVIGLTALALQVFGLTSPKTHQQRNTQAGLHAGVAQESEYPQDACTARPGTIDIDSSARLRTVLFPRPQGAATCGISIKPRRPVCHLSTTEQGNAHEKAHLD